ncbi:MAG: hypothetical protein ACRCSN_12850 [Dermatophilaceae bacterium]
MTWGERPTPPALAFDRPGVERWPPLYAPAGAPVGPGMPHAGPVVRRRSMNLVVLLMRVGAALSVLSILIGFVTAGDIRERARQAFDDEGQAVDPTLVDATVTIGIGIGVVLGLLGAFIVFLLWKKESSEFYACSSAPRS